MNSAVRFALALAPLAAAGCFVGNDLTLPAVDAGAVDAGVDAGPALDAGVLPSLQVQPGAGATLTAGAVTFAPQTVDTRSLPVTLTLVNGTDRDVTLGAGALAVQGGPPVEFVISRQPTLPTTLAPGESLTFEMIFEPVDFGTRSAQLKVASNAIPPVLTVAIAGQGAPPEAPVGRPLWATGGDSMQRYTSPDGVTFTSRGADAACPAGNPCDNYIHQFAFGAGKVIAVGAGVSDRGGGLGTRSLWSSDGVTWNEFADASAPHGPANAVAYGDGHFVLVQGGTTYRSADGVVWTSATGAPGVTHGALIYGRGRFILVGDNNAQGGTRRVSDDGLTWTHAASGPTPDGGLELPFEFGAYGRGVYVAGRPCVSGSPSGIYWSADGVDWTLGWSHAGSCVGGVAFLPGGRFLAVASDTAVTSDDGITWTATPYTPGRAPAGAGVLAVEPGADGGATWALATGQHLFRSADGLSWTDTLTATVGLGPVGFGYVSP